MYTGTYEFAKQHIEISSLYPDVHKLCGQYISKQKPCYRIKMAERDIEEEMKRNQVFCTPEESVMRQPPASYFESLAVYRKISDWLIEKETILFHGSALAVNNRGYLFTALSGTGKSTHAKLWREMLGDQVIMINDDKPLLIVGEQQVFVCGTPWSGKHRLDTNCVVPLKGIAILNRGSDNHIRPAETEEVWPILLQQAYRPEEPEKMKTVLRLLDRIRRNIPIWELFCNMDPEAACVSYEAMSWQKEGK